MKESFVDVGAVAAGGALAGWLSGRQYAAAQLAGMPAGPPGVSRGLLAGAALAALGAFEVGGDAIAEKTLALGEGAIAAELGRMTFQRGAASMAPTAKVQGYGRPKSLIGDLLDGLKSILPGQGQPQQQYAGGYDMNSFVNSLPR